MTAGPSGQRSDERWYDREAGPVVRPYALTKGRTESSSGAAFTLIDVVLATGEWPMAGFRPSPEHRKILGVCRVPSAVIDVASEVDLPIGVVRVLLGDLIDEGLLRIAMTQHKPQTDTRLLRMVLDGLQSL
jgi:hypothetical protein